METLDLIRPTRNLRLRDALVPLVAAIAVAYFAYHAMHGRYGFINWLTLQDRVATLQEELKEVRGERDRLDRRVALLRPESLDPDLLDERARAALGYADPNEIVILDRSARNR
ncbi:cell division protein FtsB [Parvibaculum indicum]|uniref:FtsB family cell division protein n=1 Tax=Parvibaculum indicum TaxID=562969 RepID=UPI0014242661|nr:septum formation initiator family protein [Parvibaculum indicum]NIJ42754.1 cell division protein FtsB [Parvibaculum indicum]